MLRSKVPTCSIAYRPLALTHVTSRNAKTRRPGLFRARGLRSKPGGVLLSHTATMSSSEFRVQGSESDSKTTPLTWRRLRAPRSKACPDLIGGSALGVRQPDVSKMLRREFRQFSVERLLRFLVALGQDVEIVVKPHQGKREGATLHVS